MPQNYINSLCIASHCACFHHQIDEHFEHTRLLQVEFVERLYIESVEIYETLNAGAVVHVSAACPDSDNWVTLWQADNLAPQLIQSSRCFSPPITVFCTVL